MRVSKIKILKRCRKADSCLARWRSYFGKAGSLSLAFLLATPHRRSGFSTWLLKTEWEDQLLPTQSSRLRFFFSPKTVQPKIGGSFSVPAAWSRLSLDSVFNLGRIWLGTSSRSASRLLLAPAIYIPYPFLTICATWRICLNETLNCCESSLSKNCTWICAW